MTRILALSDTHLEGEELPVAVVRLAREADMILHAGDFVSCEVYFALAELGRLEAVRGNSDLPALKKRLPERRVIDVEGIRIGLVHTAFRGSDLVGAQMMAREMDAKVLVFGHIHRPVVEKGKRLLICPGSPTQPRMSAPSAAMLEITEGDIHGSIVQLGSPVCDYLKFAGELVKKV
ncbi:MAG: metallophosphoesterase [Methanothrix sp.]|nr:metallophosphoesterase [Methanothrix sp.]